jgi:hypothetical protein
MRLLFVFFLILLLLLSTASSTQAQDINVHFMIGKKQSQVIQKYGNPVHQDNSNPAMLCMFYQSRSSRMIFVANNKGVYQSEASKTFNTKEDALEDLDACISKSIAEGYSVDSVTTSDFRLHAIGVKADLQMSENKLSNKFEIKMKATRTED